MHFYALACDYDGTLAHDGIVSPEVVSQLTRLKESRRRLILVTGRQLDDLMRIFPQAAMFDRIVAENGALIYDPVARDECILAVPPAAGFVEALKSRGVEPIACGKVIVCTWSPHEGVVLQTIRDLGLEMQVIFNKGAVMVLPSGVNKATGLQQALAELGLSRHNTIAVGDAENDHAMFSFCECSAAVANALPMVREHADLVLAGDHGNGVCELITMLLNDEPAIVRRISGRHQVCVGTGNDGQPVTVDACCGRILICGPSGSGKTLLALATVEQIGSLQYQFCLVDPERDFGELAGAVVLGDSKRAPALSEVSQALSDQHVNLVVSLLGITHNDRPGFFVSLIPVITQLRDLYGRPHWLIADEAHYLLPANLAVEAVAKEPLPLRHSILITVHPDQLHSSVLKDVDVVIATPAQPEETIASFCKALGEIMPKLPDAREVSNQYLFWDRKNASAPFFFRAIHPRQEHHRHLRKYAQGDLGAYHSFYFTGAQRKLNLKAQNLQMFIQLLNGIDDETWLYHLHRHDYSRWFRGSIRDQSLANETATIESNYGLLARDSREQVRSAIQSRYIVSV